MMIHENYRAIWQMFEQKIINKQTEIEAWFRQKWHRHRPPFYGSVDMRNAGYKVSPVDMNLFPGGFNNLNPQFMPLAVMAAQDAVERICPQGRSVMIVPENHTRNTFYLQNVADLARIIEQAGFEVRIASMLDGLDQPTKVETALGEPLLIEPLRKKNGRLTLDDGFSPCMVLLNNDLSGGVPDILRDVEQNLTPPLNAGWHVRRKTKHFELFNRVVEDFATVADIDPWRINPYFVRCGSLNFQEHDGEERLAAAIDELLQKIRIKYKELDIKDTPFVMVKADAGTYGMGVMSVTSADQVLGLNRRNRNRMAKVKEGLEVTEVIVQEGVYTRESLHGAVAEPVVYMMDRFAIGGFYRVHDGRSESENLNASGMRFVPLLGEIPMPEEEEMQRYEKNRIYEQWDTAGFPSGKNHCSSNRYYVYGVIARLSLLAASLEIFE